MTPVLSLLRMLDRGARSALRRWLDVPERQPTTPARIFYVRTPERGRVRERDRCF